MFNIEKLNIKKQNLKLVNTDPEVYYYTSGTLNGLHGTI
jgi:hypothetical protein